MSGGLLHITNYERTREAFIVHHVFVAIGGRGLNTFYPSRSLPIRSDGRSHQDVTCAMQDEGS